MHSDSFYRSAWVSMPMTVRLFEKEPYCSEFEATVERAEGDWVVLDQTCFYPGGGGQDPDLGTIEAIEVVEVRSDKGSIRHRVPGHRFQEGQLVKGIIDWPRRYDLMKGHSGEHLLFGSIQQKVEGLELVKIAITPDKKMVMVRGNIDWTIISECQRTVNGVIGEGMESEDIVVGRESPLLEKARVKIDRIHGDSIRIVKFGDFDMAACAGLHVKNTKEIGMLLVTKFTSAKPAGDFEIEFEVGEKARAKPSSCRSWHCNHLSSWGRPREPCSAPYQPEGRTGKDQGITARLREGLPVPDTTRDDW